MQPEGAIHLAFMFITNAGFMQVLKPQNHFLPLGLRVPSGPASVKLL